MDKILTISEIEKQFRSEWILLENPKTNEALEVQGGKVVFHSKDRDEVYSMAATKYPKRFARLYTGKISKDAAILI